MDTVVAGWGRYVTTCIEPGAAVCESGKDAPPGWIVRGVSASAFSCDAHTTTSSPTEPTAAVTNSAPGDGGSKSAWWRSLATPAFRFLPVRPRMGHTLLISQPAHE